ncbi:MAG: hypothetical protein WA971_11355, partial [Microbacterium sp.]
ELQSRAVHEAGGRWRVFLCSPRWLAGLGLLGIAVSTNFVALALTPVSAVQSMSVVALAASAAFGALTGRVVVTRGVVTSIVLCAVGIVGVIALIAAHAAPRSGTDADARLGAVMAILAALTALGLLTAVLGRGDAGRATRLCGLIAGSMVFGSITTVFTVIVLQVTGRGPAVLLAPPVLLALGLVALGGLTANVLLQRAHRVFPAPAVVAGLTVVDPLTAAVIGIAVLGEAVLTSASAALLALCGALAMAGVLGLGGLRRRERAVGASAPHGPDTLTERSG